MDTETVTRVGHGTEVLDNSCHWVMPADWVEWHRLLPLALKKLGLDTEPSEGAGLLESTVAYELHKALAAVRNRAA